MILKNASVLTGDFDFKKMDIEIEDAYIKSIYISGEREISPLDDVIDLSGYKIIPALFDIHTHGAVGTDVMSSGLDFAKWQHYLFSNGIVNFFPSTVSGTNDEVKNSLDALSKLNGVAGINLEGPYINVAKRGAHEKSAVRLPDELEMDEFIASSNNRIKITTIAPELEGAIDFIKYALSKGITVSLGHSTANYEQAVEAFSVGATHLTHTFNAMNPLDHREPNLIGAALTNEKVFCEVISDGIHLHRAIVKLLYNLLGSDRMVLISDAMQATGLPDGTYNLGVLEVIVKDGVARTNDGALAGSTYNLFMMVKCAIEFGIPLNEAIKMATLTPARAVGLDLLYGSVEEGKFADLAVVNDELEVIYTFSKGNIVFKQ